MTRTWPVLIMLALSAGCVDRAVIRMICCINRETRPAAALCVGGLQVDGLLDYKSLDLGESGWNFLEETGVA